VLLNYPYFTTISVSFFFKTKNFKKIVIDKFGQFCKKIRHLFFRKFLKLPDFMAFEGIFKKCRFFYTIFRRS